MLLRRGAKRVNNPSSGEMLRVANRACLSDRCALVCAHVRPPARHDALQHTHLQRHAEDPRRDLAQVVKLGAVERGLEAHAHAHVAGVCAKPQGARQSGMPLACRLARMCAPVGKRCACGCMVTESNAGPAGLSWRPSHPPGSSIWSPVGAKWVAGKAYARRVEGMVKRMACLISRSTISSWYLTRPG